MSFRSREYLYAMPDIWKLPSPVAVSLTLKAGGRCLIKLVCNFSHTSLSCINLHSSSQTLQPEMVDGRSACPSQGLEDLQQLDPPLTTDRGVPQASTVYCDLPCTRQSPVKMVALSDMFYMHVRSETLSSFESGTRRSNNVLLFSSASLPSAQAPQAQVPPRRVWHRETERLIRVSIRQTVGTYVT